MAKKLSEMTLEELWALFPIILKPHDPCWKTWYREEALLLNAKLPAETVRIAHIGSTAVETIQAKPIVDILVEMPLGYDLGSLTAVLADCGYRCMSRSGTRMSFNKGYTESGFAEKVFHLHLRYAGDHDELYFRDWLLVHPEDAKNYETIKLSLWKRYEHDRDGYTAQKSGIVSELTEKARAAYKGRYEERGE